MKSLVSPEFSPDEFSSGHGLAVSLNEKQSFKWLPPSLGGELSPPRSPPVVPVRMSVQPCSDPEWELLGL